MIISYYEINVRKCETYFLTSYCFLPSCPEYTDPTVAFALKNVRKVYSIYIVYRRALAKLINDRFENQILPGEFAR